MSTCHSISVNVSSIKKHEDKIKLMKEFEKMGWESQFPIPRIIDSLTLEATYDVLDFISWDNDAPAYPPIPNGCTVTDNFQTK